MNWSELVLIILAVFGVLKVSLTKKDKQWTYDRFTLLWLYIKKRGPIKYVRGCLFFLILGISLLSTSWSPSPHNPATQNPTPQSTPVVIDNRLPQSFTTTTTVTTTVPDFSKFPVQLPSNGQIPVQAIPSTQTVTQTVSQVDYLKMFINDSSMTILQVIGHVLFSAIASFVITLPFMNPEQFKILGLEYKLQAEKQEEVALEQGVTQSKIELCRLTIIESTTVDAMYEWVRNCIEQDGNLITTVAVRGVTDLIQTIFAEQGITIVGGVVSVQDDVIHGGDSGYDHRVERCIHNAIKNKTYDTWETTSGTFIFAMPLYLDEDNPSICDVVYLYSNKVSFGETEAKLFETCKNIILNHYYNAYAELESIA